VIVPYITNPFFSVIVRYIENAARDNNMNIPVVLMDRHIREFDVPFVGSDNYLGAKEGVYFLIRTGH
jgi:DNA-binding LacI/PurR family transcriptional regulator